ncbi:hypothetical protein [Glutamicibacter sp. PS]|nr:hypothetical protein [Glutamicibacter sp. PS]MDR4534657.1 hypothetical protein [Glutamicibacter sp. PS]
MRRLSGANLTHHVVVLAGAELDLDWRESPSELREQLQGQVAESAD